MMRIPAELHRLIRQRLERDFNVDLQIGRRVSPRRHLARVSDNRLLVLADPMDHLSAASDVGPDDLAVLEILYMPLGDVRAVPEVAELRLEAEKDPAVVREFAASPFGDEAIRGVERVDVLVDFVGVLTIGW